MIVFPCKCGHGFSLPEDKAGGLIQCPQCGLLNDIPTLSDLGSITDEGTYKIETPVYDPAGVERLGQLQRAFAKEKVDAWGREIDLRPTLDEMGGAGAVEIPLDAKDAVRPGAPKYDPITGELIRPMDFKTEEAHGPAGGIPMAGRAMHYANADVRGLGTSRIFMELFTGPNVFVMFFVLMTHVFLQMLMVASTIAAILLIPVAFVIWGLLLGHYANTIDETGPEAIDELPRPLRQLQWHEDLWGPFVHMMTAFLFCYGPAIWILMVGSIATPIRLAIAFIWAIVGTVVFPAVLLTSTTSGHVFNLRPDRVLGVIRRIGPTYIFTVGFWIVSAGLYLLGVGATMGTVGMLFSTSPPTWAEIAFSPFVTYPVLCVAIYLMHAFCWHLGLLYRAHHVGFPWMMQRYSKRNHLGALSAPPPPPPSLGFQVMPPKPAQPVEPTPVMNLDTDPTAQRRARLIATQQQAVRPK